MYSPFQLAIKYLRYYFTASNGKGHGVHSPFVFDFIQHVLRDKKQYDCYYKIESARKELLSNKKIIEVEDFGAGSTVIKSNQRVIKDIAASSLKPKKYAQLLYRMVKYYQPTTILELGTSFGITTSYLASGNYSAKVYTCEGAKEIATIAKQNFSILNFNNIDVVQGDFAITIPILFDQLKMIDFAFIDGNHRKAPTLAYFSKLLNRSTNSTILIFDDIHWSVEMEQAWEEIKQHPSVTLSIDLFFIGIVSINPAIKVKQHFTIRY
jgi:predicted O-methyltransferase YrrM